jgi:hypothetical protein
VALALDGQPLAGSTGCAPVRLDGGGPAARACRSPNSWAGLRAQRRVRPARLGGGRVLGEVGAQERGVQHVDRVGFPDQPLGLVGAVRRLDAPQVDPHPVGLGRLDRGHHVLVARDEHRVGDGPVPGQRLHVRPDLRVHALLLAARVQVAEPQLDPGHLRDDPLVDGRHPVPGRVVPVDPEQLAPDQIVGVLGDQLNQRDRVDPEIAAGARPEEQFARRGINVANIHHDRVAGQDGKRGGEFGHHL